MKLILAANERTARNYCFDNNFGPPEVFVIGTVQSIEGLRFRYEDVIRVPGWSNHPDIEAIEDYILRTHIAMSPR